LHLSMLPTKSPLLRSTTSNMPNPRRYQWPIRLEKERHASKSDIGFPSTAMKRITSGSAHIPAYASKSSASHSLRMSRSVSNGVVSNPFIAATVRLILRVCCHNPAVKSSDPIQRSDSCSLGVRVFWLARFSGLPMRQFASCGFDPIYRIASGDRLEVRKRRADGEREVLPAARRDSHVLSKDRCPLFRRYCDEVALGFMKP